MAKLQREMKEQGLLSKYERLQAYNPLDHPIDTSDSSSTSSDSDESGRKKKKQKRQHKTKPEIIDVDLSDKLTDKERLLKDLDTQQRNFYHNAKRIAKALNMNPEEYINTPENKRMIFNLMSMRQEVLAGHKVFSDHDLTINIPTQTHDGHDDTASRSSSQTNKQTTLEHLKELQAMKALDDKDSKSIGKKSFNNDKDLHEFAMNCARHVESHKPRWQHMTKLTDIDIFKNYPLVPTYEKDIIAIVRQTWSQHDIPSKLNNIDSEQHLRTIFARSIKASLTGTLYNRVTNQIKNHKFDIQYMNDDPLIIWLELVKMTCPELNTLIDSHKGSIDRTTMQDHGGHPMLLLEAYERDFLVLDACKEEYRTVKTKIYQQLEQVPEFNQKYYHELNEWHRKWERDRNMDSLQAIQNFQKEVRTLMTNGNLKTVAEHMKTTANLAQTKTNQSQKNQGPNNQTPRNNPTQIPREVNPRQTQNTWTQNRQWSSANSPNTWSKTSHSWPSASTAASDATSTASVDNSHHQYGYNSYAQQQQANNAARQGGFKRFIDPPFKFTKPDFPGQTYDFDGLKWYYCEKCKHFATHMTTQHIDNYRANRRNRGGGRGFGRGGGRGQEQSNSHYGPSQQNQQLQQQQSQLAPINNPNPIEEFFKLLGAFNQGQTNLPTNQGQPQGGHFQSNFQQGRNNDGRGQN